MNFYELSLYFANGNSYPNIYVNANNEFDAIREVFNMYYLTATGPGYAQIKMSGSPVTFRIEVFS